MLKLRSFLGRFALKKKTRSGHLGVILASIPGQCLPAEQHVSGVGGNGRWRAHARDAALSFSDYPPRGQSRHFLP